MSFTSQKYKKYFTLNHNGPKNVRTVQTIASIGMEMMPAGADVGCGWVYINKVGLRCIRRSLAVPPAGAKMPQKVLILFRSPPFAAARGGWMLPRGAWHNGGPFGVALFFVFLSFAIYPFM